MKKLLTPILLLLAISINTFAGDKSTKELRGDKYFFVYSFEKAIDSYTKAKQLSVEGQRRLAESYHNLDSNIRSEAAYAKLVNTTGGNLPDDYFNYAMILKGNGKYEQSCIWMDKLLVLKPTDLRAMDYAAHKADLPVITKNDGKYKVETLKVNTEADDFGASYYMDKVVFASSGVNPGPNEKRYNWNGKPFLNLYVSDLDGYQLKTAVLFDKSMKGKMHDGPASFSKDGTFMAFTRNSTQTKRKDKVVNLEICFSTFKDGEWSKPEPFVLNSKEYSVGHPCLTSDGKTMYFTSDMPGGFGGADIYRIKKNEVGEWTKAENLGNKINTEGDELFPFFKENNDLLFFASNGRYGLGGLDIFICELNGTEYGRIYNAGSPLNTSYDDFALVVKDKTSVGYFSSNRNGGGGGDDIYSVDLLKLELNKRIEGLALNKDGMPIPHSFITLQNENGSMLDTMTTKDDGAYFFFADANKNYKIVGKKDKYLDGTNAASTFIKEYIVKADVTLLQREEVIAQAIKPGADLGKILELKSIYFDLDKYNTRPDAEVELDKIVKIMNANPEMVVELCSYTDCRATVEYNQILSDKRATASAEYIKKRITKPSRVYGKGYAETKLVNGCACEGDVVSGCSEEQFQKDRRTEFIIVSNNKPAMPGNTASQP